MDDYEPIKPAGLTLKKWTAVIAAIVMIVLCIIYGSLSYTLSWRYLYDYENFPPYQAQDAKVRVIVILVLLSLFNGAVSIFGILASINEGLHMISVYSILLVVAFVLNLINTIYRPYYWAMPFWSLLQIATCALQTHGVYRSKQDNDQMFARQKRTLNSF